MEMMLNANYFLLLQETEVVTTLSKHWKTVLAKHFILAIKTLYSERIISGGEKSLKVTAFLSGWKLVYWDKSCKRREAHVRSLFRREIIAANLTSAEGNTSGCCLAPIKAGCHPRGHPHWCHRTWTWGIGPENVLWRRKTSQIITVIASACNRYQQWPALRSPQGCTEPTCSRPATNVLQIRPWGPCVGVTGNEAHQPTRPNEKRPSENV